MKIKRKIVILTAVFMLSGIFFALEASAADAGYDTNSFNVHMDVKENNSMIITEEISVNFKIPKHGIMRYIPLKGTAYYQANGEKVSLDSSVKIDQVEVKDYLCETSTEGGYLVIRIGDPDQTIKGKKTYRLSYRVRAYEDGIDAYDIFYYNVLPSEWETSIKSSSIQIKMPKSFDKDSLDVYAGSYGTNDFAKTLKVNVSGNSIRIKTTKTLPSKTGITVLQMLPEGYFVDVMNTDWAYDVMLLVAVLAALLAFLLWFFFGRDRRMVQPVEFYPPDGISSAEIGYVIDGKVDKRDIISLIISFADRGCITIEEVHKGFILHKKEELPESAKDFEHTIFNAIFPHGTEEQNISNLSEDFYDSYTAAAYQIKSQYTGSSENRLFERAGNAARVLGAVLMVLPIGAGIFLGGIFAKDDIGVYGALPISAFIFLLYFCGMVLYDRKGGMKAGKYFLLNGLLLIGSALSLLLAGLLIFYYTDFTGAIITLLCSVIAYVCTRQMRKLTVFGNQLIGRIKGFKHFLEIAELKKLKLLVDENPNYFYHVLPYVYAFGLSNKWARNFSSIDISPPDWYVAGYGGSMFSTLVFMNAFNSCTNSMQSSIKIPSSSSTGGGGGSFGGFGGGGGFSGGGFGGGGGGSW